MRERKLKEQFSAVAERLRRAQLTAEQLSALHSVQCIYTLSGEQRVLSAKLRTFLIAAFILMFVVVCFMLSPFSQLTSILMDVCGLQVTCVIALLQNCGLLIDHGWVKNRIKFRPSSNPQPIAAVPV